MKHQTLNQLLSIAEVHPEPTHAFMTRNQRLERWAELLEKNPDRALAALEGTEHLSRNPSADSPVLEQMQHSDYPYDPNSGLCLLSLLAWAVASTFLAFVMGGFS